MRHIANRSLIIFLLAVVFISCRKDKDIFTPHTNTGSLGAGKAVTIDLAGSVVDESYQPVINAKVSIGNKHWFTDESGQFFAYDVPAFSELTNVQIEKQGYFTLPKTLSPGNTKRHQLHIALMKREITGQFNSTEGGAIKKDDLELHFPVNSIVTTDGQPYQGQVKVYARYLDPESQHFSMIMPGTLLGERLDNSGVALETFGMIAVELEGNTGQKLQVKKGEEVRTLIPIPASLRSSAPDEMPMWHMTKEHTHWIEASRSIRKGNAYEAFLPRFSWWNCDVPHPRATICLRLVDEDETSVPNRVVMARNQSGGIVGIGTTDEEGKAELSVPANRALTLWIRDDCFNMIYIKDLGSFPASISGPVVKRDLGDIIISVPEANLIHIHGTLVNCDGEPVTSGVVSVWPVQLSGGGYYPVQYAFPDEFGKFHTTLVACSDEIGFRVRATDPANGLINQPVTYTHTAYEDLSLGNIFLCDHPDYFVQIEFEGEKYLLLDSISAELSPLFSRLNFSAFQFSPAGDFYYISCTFNNGQPHVTWELDQTYESIFINVVGLGNILVQQGISGDLVFSELNYTDRIVAGNFSGSFVVRGSSIPQQIKVDFRIKY